MDALEFNKAVSQHCKESGGDCCKWQWYNRETVSTMRFSFLQTWHGGACV